MVLYQSYAREMAEANGWKRLATNSAKLTNILGGYGYQPASAALDGAMRRSGLLAGGKLVMSKDLPPARQRRHGPQAPRPGAGRQGRLFGALRSRPHQGRVLAARGHKLAGESYVGRVLVLDAAKGRRRHGLDAVRDAVRRRDAGRRSCSTRGVNPIMVQGVALADFTMISGFDCDITQAIPNGAMVEIDPNAERPFIRLV